MGDKFVYQHSKLLQIIYEAGQNNLITSEEKSKIKGNPEKSNIRVNINKRSIFK
jgi:hypothetical protein